MENKEKKDKFVMHKSKASMPSVFELQMREERMVDTQKQAYIKLHQYRDRFLTDTGKAKSFSHLKGKMWFLDNSNKLDFIEIRIDLETVIHSDVAFTGTVTVQKVGFFHHNKVVDINDYEEESSEMESVSYRTYFFNAATFIKLVGNLYSLFYNIWVNTVGLNQNVAISEVPNYTLDTYQPDITEVDYKMIEEDDDDITETKNKLIKALKSAYNKVFLPMLGTSKFYTPQAGVAASGSKKTDKK